jgi:hypothetical protein
MQHRIKFNPGVPSLRPENVVCEVYVRFCSAVWKRLYGCETWSLILREEHRLRVFRTGS